MSGARRDALCAVRAAARVVLAVLCAGCSSGADPEVERSASSFCARYAELAEELNVSARTIAPVENSSPDQILGLASRAPREELEQALRTLAERQSAAIDQLERLRRGELTEDDFDAQLIDDYVRAGGVVHEQRHSLCD